jgi:hypothetical protein
MVASTARSQRITTALLWDAAALTVFAFASVLLMHPLFSGGFTKFCIDANESNDPQVFIWGLAWYPYALSHGLDPLFTRLVFAPTGYNLAWSTTIPAPALILWPITRHFGPLVSFNLLCVLAPILSSYSAFVLCRQVSKAPLPSIVGGLIYGFSSYQRIEAHHLNLALSFIPPLLVLLFLLRLENRIGRLRFGLLLAASLIFQFLVSPEIFATAILFGAAAISVSAWLGNTNLRMRLRTPVRESIAAISGAIVLLSPYLYRFIPSPFGLLPIYNPVHCSSDLLGFILPTEASLAGHLEMFRELGDRITLGSEPTAYLGLLPLIVVWSAFKPQPPGAPDVLSSERYLAFLLIGIMVLSLGPLVHLGGTVVTPSIWIAALIFPIINNALPARFMLYAFLVLSAATALWLSDIRHRASTRWLIAAAAIVSVIPATIPAANGTLPFFRGESYRKYIAPNETVMFLPFGYNGQSMKWQAQSDFYFPIAGGYLGVTPPEYEAWPIVTALLADDRALLDEESNNLGIGDQFKAFLAAHGVGTVIVPESEYQRYARLCTTLGVMPMRAGGAVVFRLSPSGLAPWRHASAAEMDTRYNLARFELLLNAARNYLARGYAYTELSPVAAVQLGLLDAAIAGDPAPSQTDGFPLMGSARRSATFQAVVRFLISHQMMRERLGVELGPVPARDASTSGIWLGPWSDASIAIGVVASPPAAAVLRARFGPSATAIYYPYPLPFSAQRADYSGDPVPASAQPYPQMMLMTFRAAALRAPSSPAPPNSPPGR